MSREWIFFPCRIASRPASNFLDLGIAKQIETLPVHLLKLKLKLNHPLPNGMSSNGEFQQLSDFEDSLEDIVKKVQSHYVGRITSDGHRVFYIYTSKPDQATWDPYLKSLVKKHKHNFECSQIADPKHEGYWDELYPSEDDWQVIRDLRVLNVLAKNGDVDTVVRRIDHWAYFAARDHADQFESWAAERGYKAISTEVAKDGRFGVRFYHEGTVQLPDISTHTVAIQRKTTDLEGEYDGWETMVCRG